MKQLFLPLLFFISFFSFSQSQNSLIEKLTLDHKNYYLETDYKTTAYVFLLGSLMANSDIDQNLISFYNNDIRDKDLEEHNENASFWKNFGEGDIFIPLALLSASTNFVAKNPVGTWGSMVSRAYLVGAPPMLLMQKVTGGSRPFEREDGSSTWDFWADENGVSGHAFMGSIPFLVASKMSNNKLISNTFLTLSTFTGISRVNDNAHFTSQAILGWYMGYMAVAAIDKTNKKEKDYLLMPVLDSEKVGLSISGSF